MCQLFGDATTKKVDQKKPIVAYRLFRVNAKGQLTSMYAHYLYEKQRDVFGHRRLLFDTNVPYPKNVKWHKAKALNDSAYPVAAQNGSCGFHAFKAYETARTQRKHRQASFPGTKLVVAKVELAGWIAVHENGYRAERMKIVRIY